jgi:hypothetical protein
MSELDDLFREGLGDRRPPVAPDLWRKIATRKAPIPAGERLDHLFADRLAHRQAAVPVGMWQRILAARRNRFPIGRTAAAVLLLLMAGLAYLLLPEQTVPDEQAGGGAQVQAETGELKVAERGSEENVVVETAKESSPSISEMAVSVTVSEQAEATPALTVAESDPRPEFSRAARETALLPPRPIEALVVDQPELIPPPVAAGVVDSRSFRGSDRHRFSGEVLLGAAYAGQQLGLRDEAGRELRDAREISEFPEVSFQLSGRLRYRLSDRFRILTGLTYVQLRNQLEYELLQNGSRELVRSSNSFHLLEVPLLLSYSVPGRRLRLNLNAGPILNVFTGAGGRYVDPSTATPQRLSDSGLYRSNTGLGWMTSLTTTYVVGKERNIQLLLEPFFKKYASSFTHPRADLSETYWMGGLQLGLRKQF